MATLTFDTLKSANALKAAGFTPAQAEAHVAILADALQVNLKDLVTKDDLKSELALFRQEIKAELAAQGAKFTAEMAAWGAKLSTEVAAQGAKFTTDLSAQGARFTAELAAQGARFTAELAAQGTKSQNDLAAQGAKFHSEIVLLRWMLTALLGLNITILGIVLRVMLVPPR